MKFYRFADKNKNTEFYKSYTLAGIKSALGLRHSWTKSNSYNLEVVEYEAKEVRRLTVDEVKQLNSISRKDKLDHLLKLVFSNDMTISFFTEDSGEIRLQRGNFVAFNSLDEAIDIINRVTKLGVD